MATEKLKINYKARK